MHRTWTLPSTATVLGVLGMIAYPVCVIGLALTLGSPMRLGPVAGWLVALAGAAAAGLPKLVRDLEAKHAAHDQAEYARRGDPVTVQFTPAPPPAPVQVAADPPAAVAGPAVSTPWQQNTT